MTDITRLTQEMKAAAEKAKHAGETPVMPFDTRISTLNEYQLTVCPDNVLALVEALELKEEQRAQQVLAFLQEYCGEDSYGLVEIAGVTYRIVDIGMRMLQPHELYRAQGFPEWYIIDQDYHGVKYAKDKQIARCGNAVPPPFAEALVRANLPELCQKKDVAA